MADSIIKKLKFPNSTDGYLFDATQLGGVAASEYVTTGELTEALEKITAGELVGMLTYMGPIGENTDHKTPKANRGDVYVVSAGGYINGTIKVEAGDLFICNTDTEVGITANWDIIQANIDVDALDDRYSDTGHTHDLSGSGSAAEVAITPAGEVSQPTFTGSAVSHNHTITETAHSHDITIKNVQVTGSFNGGTVSSTGTYTPEGTLNSVTHKPEGDVSISVGTGSVNYTPAGEVSGETDHSHSMSLSSDYTPAGTIAVTGTGSGTVAEHTGHTHTVSASGKYNCVESVESNGSHEHSLTASGEYTPAGTIADHAHTVTPTTANVLSGLDISLVGALDETDKTTLVLSMTATPTTTAVVSGLTVDNASLAFAGTAGTVSVTGTTGTAGAHNHTVVKGENDITVTGTAAMGGEHGHGFTGTIGTLAAAFTGTKATISMSGTTGTAGAHTHGFTGTGVNLAATFAGKDFEHSHTFSGTQANLSVSGSATGSITLDPVNITGTTDTKSTGITVNNSDVVAAGTVSKPTFTGTEFKHSHTVSVSGTTGADK